ncbi:MAG: Hint domain-containing protein [Pseudomonadota bacterium]
MDDHPNSDADFPAAQPRAVVRLSASGLTVGTKLITPAGERCVEDLKRGDRVLTKDFGYQQIKCVAFRDADLRLSDTQAPIKISENALGHTRPAADVYVSPTQRIALRHPLFEPIFGGREVVAQAGDLLDLAGVDQVSGLRGITYVLLGFTRPQLVLTGSLVFDLGGQDLTSARPVLSNTEARLACSMLAPQPAVIGPQGQPLH